MGLRPDLHGFGSRFCSWTLGPLEFLSISVRELRRVQFHRSTECELFKTMRNGFVAPSAVFRCAHMACPARFGPVLCTITSPSSSLSYEDTLSLYSKSTR